MASNGAVETDRLTAETTTRTSSDMSEVSELPVTEDTERLSVDQSVKSEPVTTKMRPDLTPKRWPNGPKKFSSGLRSQWPTFLCDLFISLLPLTFLVISIAALSLNGRPRSPFGQSVIEASKYGTTAFPIVFAAVIARMNKAIGLKWSEHGVKLGILEQLMGSQSLGSTIERFFELNIYNFPSVCLVLLWLLSPLGSQMTLRLLELRDTEVHGEVQVSYFNITPYSNSSFGTTTTAPTVDEAAITSLVRASLVSSGDIRKSSMDQWGNTKVPLIRSFVNSPASGNDSWTNLHANDSHDWTSLSGLMVLDLPTSGHASFTAKTSYIDATCPGSVRLGLADGAVNALEGDGYYLSINDPSTLWSNLSLPWNTAILDISETPHPRAGGSGIAPLTANEIGTLDSTVDLPRSLVFASTTGGGFVGRMGPGKWVAASFVEIFNCSVSVRYVELGIGCVQGMCAVQKVRPARNDLKRATTSTYDARYKNMLANIPNITGLPAYGQVGALDQFMMGATNPFLPGDTRYKRDYSMVSGEDLGKRLTLLINTIWQASLCPYGLGLGPSANFTECHTRPNREDARPIVTPAFTRRVLPQAMYRTTKWQAILLLLISMLLEVAAIVTTAIMAFTKAPQILGYISSLTRDNPYAEIPPGGTSLDGADRARYLADVKVRIADVRPREEVGHIAFCATSHDKDDEDSSFGLLRKGRLYH